MTNPHVAPQPEKPVLSYAAQLASWSEGRSKGERTRAQIQIATCQVLETQGPRDLKVTSICEQAGISNGTFYIYFPDRNALLDTVLMGFATFLQSSMRAASMHQPQGTIRAATAAYFDMFGQNPGLMRCLVHHLDGFPEAQTAFHQLNREWLETIVASELRHLPGDRKDDAELQQEMLRRAYALGGMVDQYLSSLLLSKDPHLIAVSQDRETVLDTLVSIWKRGMEI